MQGYVAGNTMEGCYRRVRCKRLLGGGATQNDLAAMALGS